MSSLDRNNTMGQGSLRRTAGNIHKPHSKITEETALRDKYGKVFFFHPWAVRKTIEPALSRSEPNLGRRVFCPNCWPGEIKSLVSRRDVKIPIRPGMLNMMAGPEHLDTIFVCCPKCITVEEMSQICPNMFGEIKGLKKDGDTAPQLKGREDAYFWSVVRGATKPVAHGDLSLSSVVFAHLVHRLRTKSNFFKSSHVVCQDSIGRPTVVEFDSSGLIAIPKCSQTPKGSYVHGVKLFGR